jgi:MiaB-like tRNA modifying enzyme
MKVFIETYGCTFNQADSQIMAGRLAEDQIDLVNSIDEADVIIVNTCYVKLPTESKVINKIKDLQKDFPDKKIVVSGCMVEVDPNKLNDIGPNCSWIGPHQLNKTSEVVKTAFNGGISRECGFSKDSKVLVPKVSNNSYIHVIQICEGCLGACTYCCTRFARGKLNSYPIKDIVAEAKNAIDTGCVEIELTAQDTSAYGKDTGEKFSDLIREVASLEGNFRVRIGMMNPKNIGDELDELIESFKLEKVYKFLHLPIQSGSDKVLKEMNRNHTVEEYKFIVKKFRDQIPDLTLATDIIVGYPTENDEDFQKTADLLEELEFSIIHLSKYRHRLGAVSSNLPEIPDDIMRKRSKYLTNIKSQITEKENKEFLGSNMQVLVVEKGKKGGFIAKTNSYIPVVVENVDIGSFVNVHIDEVTSTYLCGTLIN